MNNSWAIYNKCKHKLSNNQINWILSVNNLGSVLSDILEYIELTKIVEYFGNIDSEEKKLLKNSDNIYRIRLVRYHKYDKNIILGKTIIPKNTYLKFRNILDSLHNKSIGKNFLFLDQNIKRSEFYIKQFNNQEMAYNFKNLADYGNNKIWGRASIFTLKKYYKILIEEFFLSLPTLR